MRKKPKLKVEISCDVEADGSLGMAYITSSAGRKSGYALQNPFEVSIDVDYIIQKSFRKIETVPTPAKSTVSKIL